MAGRRRARSSRPLGGLVAGFAALGRRRPPSAHGARRHAAPGRGTAAPASPTARHRARTSGSVITDAARDPRHRRSALLVGPLVLALALGATMAATASPRPAANPDAAAAPLADPFSLWVIPTSPAPVPAPAAVAAPPVKPAVKSKPKAVDAASTVTPAVVPSALAASGIPSVALKAYKKAAAKFKRNDPRCGVRWELLAALGRVESNHGRSKRAVMTKSGLSVPGVYGPVLDGAGPFALIRDSDDGRFDGDKKYDRAVGPMQFLPQTWNVVKRDGNGDGKIEVQNIWDAALGAAEYLCRGNTRLGSPTGLAKNIYRYNHSDAYVRLVLGVMKLYGANVKVVPTQEPPKAKVKPPTKPVVKKPVVPKPVVKPTPSPTPTTAPTTAPPTTDPPL